MPTGLEARRNEKSGREEVPTAREFGRYLGSVRVQVADANRKAEERRSKPPRSAVAVTVLGASSTRDHHHCLISRIP